VEEDVWIIRDADSLKWDMELMVMKEGLCMIPSGGVFYQYSQYDMIFVGSLDRAHRASESVCKSR
jgi:hypothetical protein